LKLHAFSTKWDPNFNESLLENNHVTGLDLSEISIKGASMDAIEMLLSKTTINQSSRKEHYVDTSLNFIDLISSVLLENLRKMKTLTKLKVSWTEIMKKK
jgi:hypothetical protein